VHNLFVPCRTRAEGATGPQLLQLPCLVVALIYFLLFANNRKSGATASQRAAAVGSKLVKVIAAEGQRNSSRLKQLIFSCSSNVMSERLFEQFD
jgi:hypothetical protein